MGTGKLLPFKYKRKNEKYVVALKDENRLEHFFSAQGALVLIYFGE